MVEIWQMWIVIAALFVIGEIYTAGFFLFWFGVGAAVAGLLALLGFDSAVQWGGFVIVSGILFAVSRRFAEKFTKEQPPGIGADRFIGKIGVVLEEINNLENTGRVRINKDEWRADSDTGTIISVGERIKVRKLDGTHLVVKVLEEEG
jgi:membrane protein implicated in regulation of membrane protease activity